MRQRLRADLLELGLPCAVAVLAALAVLLQAGAAVRVPLALGVLFFVPGHLLVAAAAPTPAGSPRALRAAVAVGVSLPLVGLLALATTLLPGGFRPASIVGVVTFACLALAAVATLRRTRGARLPAGVPESP